MAIETVAQNTQSSFADPQNGTSPIDADEVTANDNALRGKFNTHDADPTIHVQGSDLASRPAFGTLGRKWMTRDSGVVRLFYDTGSAWVEVSYVPTSSDATITGILTFSTAPVFSGAQTFGASITSTTTITAGTSLAVTTSATIGTTLAVTGATTLAAVSGTTATFSSTFNATGNSTFGGTLGITGVCTAASFSGAGTGLTAIPAAQLTGTLPAISGANLTTLNATNLSSGTVATARLPNSIIVSTKVAAPLLGGEAAQATINLSDSVSNFLEVGASGATWATTSAPAGAGTKYYLNVLHNSIQYRIMMTPVS